MALRISRVMKRIITTSMLAVKFMAENLDQTRLMTMTSTAEMVVTTTQTKDYIFPSIKVAYEQVLNIEESLYL